MKLLLIGSGGREHALAWKLLQSPKIKTLFVAPGSDAIAALDPKRIVRWKEISAEAVEVLADRAAQEKIDLTVVGPEAPLVAGIADRFKKKNLTIFGPIQPAAQLEGSKTFAKEVMMRCGVPTARYEPFNDPNAANRFVDRHPETLWVVKADGLASGKGVFMPDAAMPDDAKNRIRMAADLYGPKMILEELLVGEEASVIGISDGKTILSLEPAQDHKRLRDGDQGPNTGGMGAYSPAPVVTDAAMNFIQRKILNATVAQMAKEGRPFSGALYAGLMMTADGPKVLEYNVRFGDPETQAILPRLKTDLAELLLQAARGEIPPEPLQWDARSCACVVLASEGYPAKPAAGDVMEGLEDAAAMGDVMIFHAGTRRVDGRWLTAAGRVLNVVALGTDHAQAVRRAYEAAEKIHFRGMQMRRDIGARVLGVKS
ncbi:MAG: phosphoribosylamine--glycine ligase [Candidatus Omnitrophica bacterium]|nr:phosphoribosylamine--glycine ligase [Candidatus Omnitrophota bacterium]